MPVWLTPILSFFGKRALHFLVYAVIGLSIWGIYHKLFISSTSSTKIGKIERQVNVYKSDGGIDIVPLIGCSAWRVQAKVEYQKPPKDKAQSDQSKETETGEVENVKTKHNTHLLDSLAFWRRL